MYHLHPAPLLQLAVQVLNMLLSLHVVSYLLILISRIQRNVSQVEKEKKVAAQKIMNAVPKDVGMVLVSKESAARAPKKGTD